MPEKPAITFYKSLTRLDVIEHIHDRLTRDNWFIDAESGKYRPGFRALDPNRNWIYTYSDPEMHCGMFLMIADVGKFVPRRCRKCWKVVVLPRTVDELMKLYALQVEVMIPSKWYCKCGNDDRPWTSSNYGGYWYCTSKDMGLTRYKRVRKLVSERINPEVPVILKRYCTEYELQFGPTDTYQPPEDCEEVEDAIRAALDFKAGASRNNETQPEYVKRHIMAKWLKKAWSIGDMTCMLYNNNEPFYRPLVTYHHEAEGGDS